MIQTDEHDNSHLSARASTPAKHVFHNVSGSLLVGEAPDS